MLDFAFSTGMISPLRGQNLVEGKKKILLFLCIQYITRYTIYLWYQNFIVQGVVFFFFFLRLRRGLLLSSTCGPPSQCV